MIDSRFAGPDTAQVDQALDRVQRTLEHSLDRAVAAVAHPAGHAVSDGRLLDRVSKVDALNEPLDDNSTPLHDGIVSGVY